MPQPLSFEPRFGFDHFNGLHCQCTGAGDCWANRNKLFASYIKLEPIAFSPEWYPF